MGRQALIFALSLLLLVASCWCEWENSWPGPLRAPLLTASYLEHVGFVAAGSDASVVTSPDGNDWTLQFSPHTGSFRHSYVLDGKLYLLGLNDYPRGCSKTPCVLYSTEDAQHWHKEERLFDGGVTTCNGVGFACDINGEAIYVQDGDKWTAVPLSASHRTLGTLACGNGTMVVSAYDTDNDHVFMYVGAATLAPEFTGHRIQGWDKMPGLAYSPFHDQFIASMSPSMFRSQDGIHWSATTAVAEPLVPTARCDGVRTCVAIGFQAGFISTNGGNSWSDIPEPPYPTQYESLAVSPSGVFVVTGSDGLIMRYHTSWEHVGAPERSFTEFPTTLYYFPEPIGEFMAVSNEAGGMLQSSSEGTWSHQGNVPAIYMMAYGESKDSFAAVVYSDLAAMNAQLYWSSTGVEWTPTSTTLVHTEVTCMAFGEAFLTLAVDVNGDHAEAISYLSSDGSSWSSHPMSHPVFLATWSHHLKKWVGTSEYSILTSSNGYDWKVTDTTYGLCHSITSDGGKTVVAVCSVPDYIILYLEVSKDGGKTFTSYASPCTNMADEVSYCNIVEYDHDNGLFYTSGKSDKYSGGMMYASEDGVSWKAVAMEYAISVESFAFGKDRLVAMTRYGALFETNVNEIVYGEARKMERFKDELSSDEAEEEGGHTVAVLLSVFLSAGVCGLFFVVTAGLVFAASYVYKRKLRKPEMHGDDFGGNDVGINDDDL